VFGFHLATVDLRQSSDKHEEVVAELLAVARIEANYAKLDEAAKRALLVRLLNDARPLRVVGAPTRPTRKANSRSSRAARTARARFGRGDPPLHHQPHRDGERPAGSAAAAKGSRPDARHAGRQRHATT
jgi:hypothetical protein